uniref:Peptidase S1 domain-containing protein n=1 Tax=Chrysemys picta bellii TaxID=8478 RepID=A0A8C3FQX4_CHRPI
MAHKAVNSGQCEIIGGWEALPHSRPYMNFMLTATHCNGESGLAGDGAAGSSGTVVGCREEAVSATGWESRAQGSDLLTGCRCLWHNAELTKWVGLVPLPEANHHVSPGSKCSVAGWGRTGVNTTTDRLHEAEQEVVLDSLCGERYRHYNPITMLCAGSPQANKSGDSGGPLVCNGVVQGIVSNGNPRGRPPSIYTRISKFIPWIKETLQKLNPRNAHNPTPLS